MHPRALLLCPLVLALTLLSVACEDVEDALPIYERLCDNGEDDDGDGEADCDDEDCAEDPACEPQGEDCVNGEDDDGDGQVDCQDTDCAGAPECVNVENCGNGEDDDGDGAVDCDDPDCLGDPSCDEPPAEDCGNGEDDDGDGAIDCDDPDCLGDPACPVVVEVCDNGVDDDGDGAIDCGDPGCEGDAACLEDCGNGEDDDGDGLVDCLDPSCDFVEDCAELCDGLDDDGDGAVDEHPVDPSIGTPCYEGPAAMAGVGQCEEGTIECFGGELICSGWVAPLPAELCDGLDNDCDGSTPEDEIERGCRPFIIPGELSRIELQTQIRDVDVHVNLDTTGSMSGALNTLRNNLSTTIVPGIREMLPTAEFGVSTFDDFPVGDFGDPGDSPFALHQRITSNVPVVQEALDGVRLHGGNDIPESAHEALYQIATGEGTTWPGEPWSEQDCDFGWYDNDSDELKGCEDPDCVDHEACQSTSWPWEDCQNGDDDDLDGHVDCDDPDCAYSSWCYRDRVCSSPVDPGLRALTVGRITAGDVDAYSITVPAGARLVAKVEAAGAGSPLSPLLSLFSQDELTELASGGVCWPDLALIWTAPEETAVVLELRATFDEVEGWYALSVTLDEREQLAQGELCADLEVGGSSIATGIFSPALAVPLVEASTQLPRGSAAACLVDCGRELDAPEADPWAEAFCFGPPTVATCGDGSIDDLEQCDNGDRANGDGCDYACRLEGTPPRCGDGHIDPGEGCDDGNDVDLDGCSARCVIEPGCGNGLREGEACDDGNLVDGDGCSSTCEVTVECGDGFRAAGEQCDDGGVAPGDGCDASCRLEPACGNGALEEGETCDDGGWVAGDGCDPECQLEETAGVPAFDWTAGFDPGLGHGTVGGVGFRETALPVIVHVTDAPSHLCSDYSAFDPSIDAHCVGDAFYELGTLGARVVAVTTDPGDDPTDLSMPLGMVNASGGVVPLCAFDGSEARLSGRCGEGQCCTGIAGAGVPPDAGGDCPLVFQIDWNGTGLDSSIINALDTLTQYIRYELTASPRDDPSDEVNALCFVESVGVVSFAGPTGTCVTEPTPVDTDGDGVNDTLANATPRTRVTFEVGAVNEDINDVDGDGDRAEACAGPGTYGLFLDVVAEGGTVVATRRVRVEVE